MHLSFYFVLILIMYHASLSFREGFDVEKKDYIQCNLECIYNILCMLAQIASTYACLCINMHTTCSEKKKGTTPLLSKRIHNL